MKLAQPDLESMIHEKMHGFRMFSQMFSQMFNSSLVFKIL